MKTKFTQLNKVCLTLIMAAAFIIMAMPASMAQPPGDDTWSLPFIGQNIDHEGTAVWNADGSGPEPFGIGHLIPLPGFLNMPFYSASRDYGDIDPDPNAAGAHFLYDIQGFPLFVQALEENGFTPLQVQLKFGLSDLGDDIEGFDWFMISNVPHSFYYNTPFCLLLDGEPMIWGQIAFNDAFFTFTWKFETSYFRPDSAWNQSSDPALIAVGRAFLKDVDDEEIRLVSNMNYAGDFTGNGRDGMFYDIEGYIEKGFPEMPYKGFANEHQGMAGWNADGSGPEESADGHGAQRYYIASRDYDDIDPDPNAAFGHLWPEMKGFLNFELQMAYRGYAEEQLLIKNGLSSLGADVMGEDWGFEGGTDYWCNYYNIGYILELAGETIIKGLVDTSKSWMNQDPLYWWCDVTYDKPRNRSALASPDAQIIAGAFIKDMGSRHLINNVRTMTYDTATFSGNGRYDGGFFNVTEASMEARSSQACTFIQTDTIGGGFSNTTHWTTAGSPYFIDNDILVHEDHTLVIDPGVKVAIRGPYSIDVNGNIEAIGEEGDTITFTRSNPLVKWNSMRIPGMFPDADSSIFSYCIFENGYANSAVPLAYNSGGAVKIGSFDKVRFSNCLFRNNLVNVYGAYPPSGGALALWTASPLIENSTFYSNEAEDGGAIICFTGSNPHIKNCTFYNNSASDRGGAIICYDNSSPVIEYNLFHHNFAGNRGGALSVEINSNPQLINNTLTENRVADTTSDSGGGAVNIDQGSHPSFTNNIFWENYSKLWCQVSIFNENCAPVFAYNDMDCGTDSIGPVLVDPALYTNNIEDDPIFCIYDEVNPYVFADCSPCLNAGQGGMYIGAFDWGCVCDDIPEQLPGGNELSIFPNPSYSKSPISLIFILKLPGHARLEIYNLTGEKVAEPVNRYYTNGEHQVTISTEGLPTGIYIGRLTAGNQAYIAKFIKMR